MSNSTTCPHCGASVFFVLPEKHDLILEEDEDGTDGVNLLVQRCPACDELIIDRVHWQNQFPEGPEEMYEVTKTERLYPPACKIAQEIPEELQEEYEEARRVAPISAKAGAALARRCLQAALRDKGFKAKRLVDEIALVSKDPNVTALLRQKLEIVREVGNFAAHPTDDGNAGYLEVAPGEVEALFAALDDFFDVFYVKPAQHAKQLAAINAKLSAANRKPII